MELLLVILVETNMIDRNLNHVEKSLKVGIAIQRIKELLEGNILELRMSREPVIEKANVLIARPLGTESIVLVSNLELARLSNLSISC
jgi:hypothetical protein